MITKMKIFIIFGLFCLLLNCSSQRDLLRTEKPDYYNKIVNTTWFIFDPHNAETLVGQIKLTESGKVVGDFSKLLLEKDYSDKLKWSYANNKIILISENKRFNYSFNIVDNFNVNEWRDIHPVFLKYNTVLYGIDIFFSEDDDTNTHWHSYVAVTDVKTSDEIRNQYMAHEKEKAERIKAINNKWKTINRNSLKELVSYYNEVKDNNIKDEVENTIHVQIDNKVKKYLSQKYSKYAKYINSSVILQDGSEFCKFYELTLRLNVGARNSHTGSKGSFTIEKYSDEEILLSTKADNGNELGFIFKPYKNKLVFKNMVGAGKVWDYDSSLIALMAARVNLTDYPAIEHIDYELLDQY